jgi:hypothetical protein
LTAPKLIPLQEYSRALIVKSILTEETAIRVTLGKSII